MANKYVIPTDPVTNTPITAASDETLIMLRRIVKLLESNAVVDYANRQRVTVDQISTMPTVTCTLASTTITALPFSNTYHFDRMEQSRIQYALAIRANLIWS